MNTILKKKEHLVLCSKLEYIIGYRKHEFGSQTPFHKLCESTLNSTFFLWKDGAKMKFNYSFFTVTG